MPLKVIEQAPESPTSNAGAAVRTQRPRTSLAWGVVSLVAAAQVLLNLARSLAQGASGSDLLATDQMLTMCAGAVLVLAGAAWARRLGGGVLAMVCSAVAVSASPGTWAAMTSIGVLGLVVLAAVFAVPPVVGAALARWQRSRSSVGLIAVTALGAVLWAFSPTSTVAVFDGSGFLMSLSPILHLGLAQLVMALVAWAVLVWTWGFPQVRRGQRARSTRLPEAVQALGLWIACTSLLITFALLASHAEVLLVASLWTAVPFGLSVELLRRNQIGKALVWLILITTVIQLAVIGLRLV